VCVRRHQAAASGARARDRPTDVTPAGAKEIKKAYCICCGETGGNFAATHVHHSKRHLMSVQRVTCQTLCIMPRVYRRGCTCSSSICMLAATAALRALPTGTSCAAAVGSRCCCSCASAAGDGGECSPTLNTRALRELRADIGGMLATRSLTDSKPLPASSSARALITPKRLNSCATASSAAASSSPAPASAASATDAWRARACA